jgi:hypothetical protein
MVTFYDFNYYTDALMNLSSADYEKYGNKDEIDLFIDDLNNGKIESFEQIDWTWLRYLLCGEEYYDGQYYFFDPEDKLDIFMERILSHDKRVKILEYLRDNCQECLFGYSYRYESVFNFRKNCARLISKYNRERGISYHEIDSTNVIASKKPGPKKQFLFMVRNGVKDEERTKKEANQFKQYIADKCAQKHLILDSRFENEIYNISACFWKCWHDIGLIDNQVSGTKIVRFLHEDCGLEFNTEEKACSTAFGKFLNKRIYDPDILKDVTAYFPALNKHNSQ